MFATSTLATTYRLSISPNHIFVTSSSDNSSPYILFHIALLFAGDVLFTYRQNGIFPPTITELASVVSISLFQDQSTFVYPSSSSAFTIKLEVMAENITVNTIVKNIIVFLFNIITLSCTKKEPYGSFISSFFLHIL